MDRAVYERATEPLVAEFGAELVALDPNRGECFGFNEVAATVWHLLEKPRTLDDLVDALTATYAVDRHDCADDVRPLLEQLEAKGLVRKATNSR